MDPAKINGEVQSSLLKIVEQYVKGKVVTTYGYTRFMLDVLRLAPMVVPSTFLGEGQDLSRTLAIVAGLHQTPSIGACSACQHG